jgi:hypothetical protein
MAMNAFDRKLWEQLTILRHEHRPEEAPIREADRIRYMASIAWALHVCLKYDGHPPVLNPTVVRNRGGELKGPEFYEQVHAIDELLKFASGLEMMP